MRRIEQLKTDDSAPSPEGRRVDLLGEWIAHLRQRRASLREEGARRMREANVLPAMSEAEPFSEATSLHDNLPILGAIVRRRARQLTEQLLRGIRTNRAKVVVVDITGVPDVFEKWVARATRPCRSATRRPARARLPRALGRPHWLAMPGPFRPASRRTAPASGLCYPNRNFQTRSQTLVTLGVDLTTVHAVGDFQGGIEEAEQLLGHKVDKMGQHAAGGGEYHASSNSQTT